MSLKVKQHPERWYFSNGIFTEHMQALYDPKENKLTIIGIKYLPQVIKYLQQKLEVSEIILEWFKPTKG